MSIVLRAHADRLAKLAEQLKELASELTASTSEPLTYEELCKRSSAIRQQIDGAYSATLDDVHIEQGMIVVPKNYIDVKTGLPQMVPKIDRRTGVVIAPPRRIDNCIEFSARTSDQIIRWRRHIDESDWSYFIKDDDYGPGESEVQPVFLTPDQITAIKSDPYPDEKTRLPFDEIKVGSVIQMYNLITIGTTTYAIRSDTTTVTTTSAKAFHRGGAEPRKYINQYMITLNDRYDGMPVCYNPYNCNRAIFFHMAPAAPS